MNEPLVSIILSAYNREKYIKKAIQSVLDQTYKNIELIIIDDGSTDGTKDVVGPYLVHPWVRYIYQKNKGVSVARNNGIKISAGKYIAILDSDDFWCDKDKLKKQIDFLEKNEDYVLVGGGIIKIDKTGKELARRLLPQSDEEIRKLVLMGPIFVHSTVVFRKKSWAQAQGYDEKLVYCEDWDLWLKFGKIGKFYNFQEYFVCYMQWENNISNHNALRNLKIADKLRKKYRNDYTGFMKGVFLGWINYFFYYFPIKEMFHPLFSKIKFIIFGY